MVTQPTVSPVADRGKNPIMQFPSLNWPAKEIRLLRLLPAADADELVRCELQVLSVHESSRTRDKGHRDQSIFDLAAWRQVWDSPTNAVDLRPGQDAPAIPLPNVCFSWGYYIALSYMWGDKNRRDLVFVDDQPVSATKNLVDALKALRSKGSWIDDSLIWADSLCVDQDDVADRNRHVSFMRSIYANAGYTVAWLGEEHSMSGLAFDLIYDSLKAAEHQIIDPQMEENPQVPDAEQAGSWLALLKFMDREYWSRVWIIQELCFGSPFMPILCGHRALPWKLLYTAVWEMHQNQVISLINAGKSRSGQPQLQEGHKDVFRRSFLYHINIEQLLQSGRKEELSARNRENTRESWHIMPILDLARRSSATLNHDKVYGLMGLLPKLVRQALKPDYDAPVDDVFASFARAWITHRGDLEILSHCTWINQSNLPSWTPDWRHQEHMRLFGGANSPYHPCNGTRMVAHFSQDGSTLQLQGIPLDTLDGLGTATISSQCAAPDCVQALSTTSRYTSDREIRDALWRTLVGNITTRGHKAPDSYGSLLEISLHKQAEDSSPSILRSVRVSQFRDFILASAQFRIGGRPLADYFDIIRHDSSLKDPSNEQSNLENALEQAFRFSRLRRLATTIRGSIAMVPNAAIPGDIVCGFPGCTVPIVVRQFKSRGSSPLYRIVGACYIDGYMYGEALKEVDSGILTFENMDLR